MKVFHDFPKQLKIDLFISCRKDFNCKQVRNWSTGKGKKFNFRLQYQYPRTILAVFGHIILNTEIIIVNKRVLRLSFTFQGLTGIYCVPRKLSTVIVLLHRFRFNVFVKGPKEIILLWFYRFIMVGMALQVDPFLLFLDTDEITLRNNFPLCCSLFLGIKGSIE